MADKIKKDDNTFLFFFFFFFNIFASLSEELRYYYSSPSPNALDPLSRYARAEIFFIYPIRSNRIFGYSELFISFFFFSIKIKFDRLRNLIVEETDNGGVSLLRIMQRLILFCFLVHGRGSGKDDYATINWINRK